MALQTPFYNNFKAIYFIESIVCKQFSDSLWILTIINSSHNMTGGYFDINPDHNQLISWSWVENYPDIDPDHTHNSFPNGKLLAQHTQLTSSIISIATTTQLSSKNVNHCFTTRLTFIQPYSLQLEWTKKKKTHTHTHADTGTQHIEQTVNKALAWFFCTMRSGS
jgi:hypothetical protein